MASNPARWTQAWQLGWRFALPIALLAAAIWAWRSEGYTVTAAAASLAVVLAGYTLLRFSRRGERDLLRLMETWAVGERATWSAHREAHVERLVRAINTRLYEDRGRLLTEAQALQALLDHAPAPLLRMAGAGGDMRCEALNNAARRLLAALGVGERPAPAAFGADFARVVTGDYDAASAVAAPDAVTTSIELRGLPQRYLVSMSEISTAAGPARIVALQNVQTALDQTQMNAWRDLTRVLSHEIMNALVPITSLAESALRELRSERACATVEQAGAPAEQAVQTLARRAQALMAFVEAYRVLAKPVVVQSRPIDAAGFLDECAVALRAEWGDAVQVRCRVEPPALRLHADPALLQQAIGNILRNAAQAAVQGEAMRSPSVNVFVEVGASGRVRLIVDDSGPGIAPEQRETVFLPFFTTKPEGTGVGLSLVRQIVLAHGGRLNVGDSALGGARFVVEL